MAISNDEAESGCWSPLGEPGPGLIKCIENVSIPAKFLESHEKAKEHQMIFDRKTLGEVGEKGRMGVEFSVLKELKWRGSVWELN